MDTKFAEFQLALAEAAQSRERAAHFNMRIATGVYKTRVVRHGSIDGPVFTEDELLRDEVATALRHIHLAEEHIDHAKGLLAEMKAPEPYLVARSKHD